MITNSKQLNKLEDIGIFILLETHDNDNHTITTNLLDSCEKCEEYNCEEHPDWETAKQRIAYNNMINGMESLILALYSEEFDVTDSKFQSAVNSTINAIENHC